MIGAVINDGPDRRNGVRLGLLSVCLLAGGCNASVNQHTDYFEKMANRMPRNGQLRMRSQLGGLSAAYLGPGRGGSCAPSVKAAKLLDASYSDAEGLRLVWSQPVSIVAGNVAPLELFELRHVVDGPAVPAGDLFEVVAGGQIRIDGNALILPVKLKKPLATKLHVYPKEKALLTRGGRPVGGYAILAH